MATGGERSNGPLEALVLAAGAGSRFGGSKLLAPWRGGVLLDGALAAAFAAPARTVTVITGAHAEGVTAAARAFAARAGAGDRLRLIHAVDHGLGLSASLRAGIASLGPDAGGAFVFLADMPGIPVGVATSLAEALAAGALAAAPMFEGQRGHPVLLSAALFDAILGLDGDHGAGHILAGLGDRLVTLPVADHGVTKDIDRPADLD
jgi:molybdenum cofactor cytidylyltransferase